MFELLRLATAAVHGHTLAAQLAAADPEETQEVFERWWNAALDCTTPEAALALLSQILQVEQADIAALTAQELKTRIARAELFLLGQLELAAWPGA